MPTAAPLPAGQSFAPGLNPLGLFSFTTQGNSTIQAGTQTYNPGDVPAPPQYGSGAGAPTNFTQTNFGGFSTPNMAASLNTQHPYVLAAPAPRAVAPAPAPAPSNPPRPVLTVSPTGGQGYLPPQSPGYQPTRPLITGNNNLYREPTDTELLGRFSTRASPFNVPISNLPSQTPPTTYNNVPNTGLSKSAMRIPSSPLSFNSGARVGNV